MQFDFPLSCAHFGWRWKKKCAVSIYGALNIESFTVRSSTQYNQSFCVHTVQTTANIQFSPLFSALRNCRRSPIIMNMNAFGFFLASVRVFLFVLIFLSIAMQLADVHFPHSCSWRDKTVCLQFRAVWRTEFVLTFWHVYICVFFSFLSHSPIVYSHCDFAFVCCFVAKPE